MIQPRVEERDHIGKGNVVGKGEVRGEIVYILCRKKTRSLVWTADLTTGRKLGLPAGNKGDFLGWIENSQIRFLPVEP
jgi:hypothetical protein